MNRDDFEDSSSLYILGKEFIIVIVVISSALSFTLGYYVGKSSENKKAEFVSEMSEITPLPQEQEPLSIVSAVLEEIPQDYEQPIEQSREYKQTDKEKSVLSKTIKARQRIKKPIKQTGQKIIYTVQMAAFKNAVEAENFKAKYDKKGYMTYIVISKNKRNEKIHKIRTGEFKGRKDAEILSLKLKKTEGLNTFVTFKGK